MIIGLMVISGSIVYLINGIGFGYALLALALFIAFLYYWHCKKPNDFGLIVTIFLVVLYLFSILGGYVLNGLDGSAPVILIIFSGLGITLVKHKYHLLVISLAVAEVVFFRIEHSLKRNLIINYSDYGVELTDKTFIFIVVIITSGLLIRAFIKENSRENKLLKKFQQELKLKNQELKLKKDQLDQFATLVSHDLKAPIRHIQFLTRMFEEDFNEAINEDQEKVIKLLLESSTKAQLLVEDIFEYCKLSNEKIELELLNVDQLGKTLIEQVNFPKTGTLDIDLKALDGVISSEIGISRILENLVSNAIKYGDKEILQVTITSQIKGDKIVISVSDNGPGIEEKFQSGIFEMLNTAGRKSKESTGVGLAIVKSMAKRLGGDAWLESTIGCGSTFYFSVQK